MSFLRSLPFRVIISLALLAALVALIVVAFVPVPYTLHTTAEDATVTFTVDDRLLLTRDSCTTVRWDTANIESIYYNGNAVVGTFEEPYCPNTAGFTEPLLLIYLPNQALYTFSLPVFVLADFPLLIAGVALLAFAGLLAFVPLPALPDQPDSERRGLLRAGGGALLLGLLALAGFAVYRQAAEPEITVCNGWIVRADELRQTDCTGSQTG